MAEREPALERMVERAWLNASDRLGRTDTAFVAPSPVQVVAELYLLGFRVPTDKVVSLARQRGLALANVEAPPEEETIRIRMPR